MKTFILLTIPLLVLFFLSHGLEAQNCNKLPTSFDSYEQAVKLVQSSTFKIVETANTSSSSWIRGAKYYSCDGKTGFLIIWTDDRRYIHQNVPISVWREFKNASSFGSYYSNVIKGRYPLLLSNN